MTIEEIRKMYADKFDEIYDRTDIDEEQKNKMFSAFHTKEAREIIYSFKE